MKRRRQFLKILLGFSAGAVFSLNPLMTGIARGVRKMGKTVLEKGTARETLINKNPADLDAGNLKPTPLEDFGTMGLTDYSADMETWRLEVGGEVGKALRLGYTEIKSLPPLEKKVLLICPGFFANQGLWKGFSIGDLLELAEASGDITHVTLRGPEGTKESLKRFPIEDIRSNKVFLAYEVNGKPLPQRHGFPLRTVAEDYYGYDWVKYVYKVTAEKI